ncbi:alpha-ketoglutarate-dependent dioxygenase alkB homolog 6-like [Physella acuta]|uniref:alpha-ketoglutarate-dependent dioxygenase alkB homolog 6-like n=1 Tax=Physella acuta TaxID=109671 RepID=UPI0027DCC5A6|nr:alpha-ketoglutarate-dependent dioxygenase alkB homolog 6-like [Physella acuta]XP_059142157.1 alpha-ketoglutarate-dependent dioxygenase alkB homolog 6-like [Physella acuta]
MSSKSGLCQQNIVKSAPPTLYYLPDFITKAEEEFLLNKVYSAPKPKWDQLSHRKLQNWGGLPRDKGMIPEKLPDWLQIYMNKIAVLDPFEGNNPNHVLVNEYLPGQGIMPHEDGPLYFPTVSTISLGSHTVLDFYHHQAHPCIDPETSSRLTELKVSEDKVQQTGDNSGENVPTSLESRYLLSVLLEPRSLFLVRDDMYTSYLHGISERTSDVVSKELANFDSISFKEGDVLERGTRVSLTIRYVPKVIKTKFLF